MGVAPQCLPGPVDLVLGGGTALLAWRGESKHCCEADADEKASEWLALVRAGETDESERPLRRFEPPPPPDGVWRYSVKDTIENCGAEHSSAAPHGLATGARPLADEPLVSVHHSLDPRAFAVSGDHARRISMGHRADAGASVACTLVRSRSRCAGMHGGSSTTEGKTLRFDGWLVRVEGTGKY